MKTWDRRANYAIHPNWDTDQKKEARRCSVIAPYRSLTGKTSLPRDKQYWTMCGAHYHGAEGNFLPVLGELGQLTSDGLIACSQWRGVDREAAVIENNRKLYPDVWWKCGDFYDVMRAECAKGKFNPGLVNYDGVMSPKYSVPYLVKIMSLIDHNIRGSLVLIANFVLKSPYRTSLTRESRTVFDVLKKSYAVPDHWKILPFHWSYRGGASKHSHAGMGTFVFVKSVHSGTSRYTKGRNLLMEIR